MKCTTIEAVPQWALNYLEYGDDSLLTAADRDLVDQYRTNLYSVGIRLVAPIDGTESEFCAHPAFGDACATIDYTASVARRGHN